MTDATPPQYASTGAVRVALSETLQKITGSTGVASFDVSEMAVDAACFVMAWSGLGDPLGCGAIRPLASGVAELKRMHALPGSRGVGAGVLAFLERQAVAFGYCELWLESRRANQRADDFYRRHGYREIDHFGRYVDRPEAIGPGKWLPSNPRWRMGDLGDRTQKKNGRHEAGRKH